MTGAPIASAEAGAAEVAAPRARIAVLARAPVPGGAKTRLVPALGAAGAARLAERMLDHAVAQAVAAALGPVTVWAAPDADHPAFAAVRRRHGAAVAVQGAGDLGRRMAGVFQHAFAPAACAGGGMALAQTCREPPRAGTKDWECGKETPAVAAGFDAAAQRLPLLLMGTDAPALDAAMLRAAAAALGRHAAVFVPAFDGGYALVGLRAPPAQRLPLVLSALFDGMPWSTPRVMSETRRRLVRAGCSHAELSPVADIDLPADLRHLPPDWLPETADR